MANIARTVALVVPVALLLGACATMSPEECRTANWYEVGRQDGLDGKSLSTFDSRREACAEVKVVPDSPAYYKGRTLGLKSYCQLDNAITVGLQGGRYDRVCPPPIDAEFLRRYEIAHTVYHWRTEVTSIDNSIDYNERRLRELDREEDKARKDAKSDDDRKRVRRDFEDKRHRVREALHDLDYRARSARDRLRAAELELNFLR